jgi:hypothetical protein
MLPGSSVNEIIPVNTLPLIEFGDFDRDAMMDMVYFLNGSIYTFYNRY